MTDQTIGSRIRTRQSERSTNDDPFDRQRRIANWPQSAIEEAKILILGAGAIGNETLKNLVLVGVRNLLICDFDHIETSNLSRTVLFRSGDIGKRKAEIAAIRTAEMALSEEPRVEWFAGDVVWDLGLYRISEFDLILGCLDNVEARRAMNRAARLLGIPYIDAGIRELSATVAVFGPAESQPCYECGLSNQQLFEAHDLRYSCYNTKKALVKAELVPTVQLSAAMAGALQAQEAVRWLGGDKSMAGHRIVWIGETNTFRRVQLTAKPNCDAHARLPAPTVCDCKVGMTLFEFIDTAEALLGIGPLTLDLSGDRSFVSHARCHICSKEFRIDRPLFRLTDNDLSCLEGHSSVCPGTPSELNTLWHFSRATTPELGNSTLENLGIPKRHIVCVTSLNGEEHYLALAGD
jgi:adenylyltransferase/sulfurtransferase